ncbi:type II/IV secretion system ATPase subunit [Methanohalobium sp.]|uniref:type II/IV secretion system ATPase subunit n=1 Tax=Methanohalobium sp. TaxID=2837493 RepID=UPI0039785089
MVDLNLKKVVKRDSTPESEEAEDTEPLQEKQEEVQEQEETGNYSENEENAADIAEKDKKSSFNIIKKIQQIFKSSSKEAVDPGFDVGEISEPKMGEHFKDVDVTYEVEPPFQYAHIYYNGEEIVYEALEPPMSEGEQKSLNIIENAFEKMSHSEMLLMGDERREDVLKRRYELLLNIYQMKLSEFQKEKLFYYLLKKYTGFGLIDILMKDPYIEDINCNGPGVAVYINHRMYGSTKTNLIFNEVDLNNFVLQMAQSAGQHISILEPIKDVTLTDGSRANLTLGKEVTRRGSTFTIRRFKTNPVSAVDLVNYGTFDSKVLAFLWLILEYKRSILAAGGTASGKTTTLNALGAFIPPEYKIVSIEDTPELNLMHPNWTQSVTRAGFGGDTGQDGKAPGDIELYDLLAAALRQRPEYIVVGEVRGSEAGTLFQAISVGHPALGTIHSGSIKELVSRVESKPMEVPRNLFASLDAVIFNSMIKVGEHFLRRAVRIVEIIEVDPDTRHIITNPAYRWDPSSDTFEFSGYSALLEQIKEEYGLDDEYISKEIENRSNLLESLAEKGVTDYETVSSEIRRYLREKDEMMEELTREKTLTGEYEE